MHYCQITINCKERGEVPQFIGSMLRGAFGVSLKRIVCTNPSYRCENCLYQQECLYYDFFEKKNRFHNFRFDFELYPKRVKFSLFLFNEAIKQYHNVFDALIYMLTQLGLGKEKRLFEIEEILINGKKIDDKDFSALEVEPEIFFCDSFAPIAKLKLLTPLRIKRNGRFLNPHTLEAKDILVSLHKKKSHYDHTMPLIEHFPKIVMKDLKFIDFTRYSNRQKRKMKLGGIVGEILLSDLTPQTYELLKFGEVVGVGKLGTFGLGKIILEPLL